MNGWLMSFSFHRYRHIMAGGVLCVLMAACGTGIEMTEHVTEKDVRRAIDQKNSHQATITIDAYVDSVPAWKTGKRFWVADDHVRLLFAASQDYDVDTVTLAGHELSYMGYSTGSLYDNRMTLTFKFQDKNTGNVYVYRTDKTIEDFTRNFSIPMLIDMDMVAHMARQITNKDYYVRTPIWYDRESEQMIDGRHFIKVHIDSVLPGNSVMPLRVMFTALDNQQKAMVWLSDKLSVMHGRDFDALFVAANPRLGYPDISDENWKRITRGQVVEGMTKEECRLSLGNPKHINQRPDQSGMREYWYYDGGYFLYFVAVLLSQYRR